MRSRGKIIGLSLFIFPALHVLSQTDVSQYHEKYKVSIHKSATPLKIDGVMDEPAWQSAETASGFWLKWPVDTSAAKRQTEVRMTYDDHYLYFGIINYDTNYYVIQSLKRDGAPEANDGVGLVLDPVNEKSNGFFFYVSPYNVQYDDLLSANGDGGLSLSWDNKWISQTRRMNDRWVAEIAIPFATLRYDKSKTQWGINFIRTDLKNNEYSTWTRVPLNLNFFDFGYLGSLNWDAPPPSPGKNISFIPYITGGVNSDAENGQSAKGEFNAGFDGKLALSSNMNLDLTVNPDFSQVEVDQQQTNLTRFSLFFPEKRNFFLENSDLYANYGIPGIRPFYSRTIGLDNNGNRIPIIAGARLTGNIDSKTRLGIMNIQTAKKDSFAAQNYTAITYMRKLLQRSSVKIMYLDREAFMGADDKKAHPLDRYGKNAGLELTFTDKENKWNAWYAFHKSWKYGISGKDIYQSLGFGYSGRKFNSFTGTDHVGTNYYADMGFIQRINNYDAERDTTIRLGFRQVFNFNEYAILPKKGRITNIRFGLENYIAFNPDYSFNEFSCNPGIRVGFRNTAQFRAGSNIEDLQLQYPASFTDTTPLPRGHYRYAQYYARYASDIRKNFSWILGFSAGGFYNGNLQQFSVSMNYKIQPWGNFSLRFESDQIQFPAPYGSNSLFLVAPKVEISFSNSLFWTTFIQYNTQENNLNINSRFQWRFKPLSDLYIVYTDNYFNNPFLKNRNRALIFKLNYWLSG